MINLNIEECIGCSACINTCPQQAISIENSIALINQHKCNQCGQCVTACPVEAIHEEGLVRATADKSVSTMIVQGGFGRGYRGRSKGHNRTLCSLHSRQSGRKW